VRKNNWPIEGVFVFWRGRFVICMGLVILYCIVQIEHLTCMPLLLFRFSGCKVEEFVDCVNCCL
jgi:hypothetical protein